jgi:hypothetical protein
MKMFVHTFNTWFLAHLLHPFILITYFLLKKDSESSDWTVAIFLISVFSFFASIPALFIAWFLKYVIANTDFSVIEKFITWIMSVVVAIFLNFLSLKFLFSFDVGDKINDLIVPSILAAILSIVVRSKQFFAFQLNYNSIKNENNLV